MVLGGSIQSIPVFFQPSVGFPQRRLDETMDGLQASAASFGQPNPMPQGRRRCEAA
ncbi:hypothetical protein N9R71_02705 [Candidatus Poseidoniales archaeon]|nr:hypothetical protein [Candidatus Poseidoniales archaeon]